MSKNLSEQKREKLLNNIKIMRKKLQENPELLQSLADMESELKRKKYGLVWEEHEEKVDEELKTKIPVFVEDKDLEIKSDDNKSFNFLLEGDNLHSLYLLEKTHKEKIDLIYIDPPYNTGNKDFVYDDSYLSKDDGFKHSKWLSFMEKRLKIAYKLMKEEGIIFISIDDNEQAQLKLLCDEIFGDINCLGILPTIMNLKGNQDQFGFAGTHEYTLVYSKNITKCSIGYFEVDEEKIEEEWLQDEIGYYKKGASLKSTGVNAPKEKRPNLYFPIYVLNKKQGGMINENNKCELKWSLDYYEGYVPVFPITNGKEMTWRWSKNKFKNEYYNVIITSDGKEGISFYKKQRPALGDIPTQKPKSFFYKPEYSSGNGTNQLLNIFGTKVFNNPKPVELIKDFIKLGTLREDATILDFFAGSGTTAQAIMELNEEYNKNMKFILCTNNENGICKNITYKRIEKVIMGYLNKKEKKSNLKYYKTEYIDRFNHKDEQYYIVNELSKYIKELVQLENGIDASDNSIQILFTDEEVDNFSKNIDVVNKCKILYVDTNALIADDQMELFENNNITVSYIPEYYFEDEILEVEQW